MHALNNVESDQDKVVFKADTGDEWKMLSECGYSDKAIKYYLEKPYMGTLSDADQVSDMLGSCGDTMKIFLKVDNNKITDIRYQVLGCPGAISAAMAAVDLVKGKSLEQARELNDGDIFSQLVDIPAKKHHCIQLAVKTLHKAIEEYKNGHSDLEDAQCHSVCPDPSECCKSSKIDLQ